MIAIQWNPCKSCGRRYIKQNSSHNIKTPQLPSPTQCNDVNRLQGVTQQASTTQHKQSLNEYRRSKQLPDPVNNCKARDSQLTSYQRSLSTQMAHKRSGLIRTGLQKSDFGSAAPSICNARNAFKNCVVQDGPCKDVPCTPQPPFRGGMEL